MTLGPDDLVLSQFSLRGVDFDARVRAAALAGFAAIGLATNEYLSLHERGWTDARLVSTLVEHGLVVDEIEALRLDGSGPSEDVLWRMADVFGPTHAHVLGPYAGELADAAAAYGRLFDAAATHGVRLAIEFYPPTNVADVSTAMAIVVESGRAGGLCVDTWHHFRGSCDWDALSGIPPDRVISVQVSDGPATPDAADYLEDTLHHRLPPGEGSFDLVRFVRTLDARGVVVPWSIEVMSRRLAEDDAAAVAQRCADGMRAVLAAARASSIG